MSKFQFNLDELIKSINLASRDLPLVLPPTHLSRAKNLKSILTDNVLKPFKLKLGEKKELLCLFYGGIFYRFSEGKKPQDDPGLAPIAFVFKPSILSRVYRYFPFDTGVLQKHQTEMSVEFEYYEVNPLGDLSIPRKMVYEIFSTNDNYLSGQRLFNSQANLPPLRKALYDLYETAQAKFDADWRVCTIECQFDKEISLEDLEWIGFPDIMEQETMDFRRKYVEMYGPTLPDFDHYPFRMIFYPDELAYQLEQTAYNKIFKNYLLK